LTYKGTDYTPPVDKLKVLIATSIGKFNSWCRNSNGKYSPLGEKLRERILQAIDVLDTKPLWHLELPSRSSNPLKGLLETGNESSNEGKRLVKIRSKVVEFYSPTSGDVKDTNSNGDEERRLGVGLIKEANIHDIDTESRTQGISRFQITTNDFTPIPAHDPPFNPIDVAPLISTSLLPSNTTDKFPPIIPVDLQISTSVSPLPNHTDSAPVKSLDDSDQIIIDGVPPIATPIIDLIPIHSPVTLLEKPPMISADVFENFYAIRVLASEIAGNTRLFLSLEKGFEGDKDVEQAFAKKEIDLMEVEDTLSRSTRREFNLVCWRLVLSNELKEHRRELSKRLLTVQAREKIYTHALHNLTKSKHNLMTVAETFLMAKKDAVYKVSVKNLSYSHGSLCGTAIDMETDFSKGVSDYSTNIPQLSVKNIQIPIKKEEKSEAEKSGNAIIEAVDLMDLWTARLLRLDLVPPSVSTSVISYNAASTVSSASISAYPRNTISPPLVTTANSYNRVSTSSDYFRNYASFVLTRAQPPSHNKVITHLSQSDRPTYVKSRAKRVIRVDGQLLLMSDIMVRRRHPSP
jgi:hypothetical protein